MPLEMKSRYIIAAAICAALGAWCLTSLVPAGSQPAAVRPSIRFVAFTNAILGPQEPILAMPGSRHQTALQSWFASGTNAAIFTITNHQNRTLLITAHGQLFTQGRNPDRELAYLLQPTGFPEFFLPPGQAATIQVAFRLRRGPWKLRLSFSRDSREHSVSDVLRGLSRALGRPSPIQRSPVDSEWIDSLPAGQTIEMPEPQHAADGGQPSSSVTIRTSVAAGSRR